MFHNWHEHNWHYVLLQYFFHHIASSLSTDTMPFFIFISLTVPRTQPYTQQCLINIWVNHLLSWIMLRYNDQSCIPITKRWFLLMCIVFRVRIPEHRHNTSTRPLAPHTPHCARHTTNMKLHLPLEVYNSDNTEEINLLNNILTFLISVWNIYQCLPESPAFQQATPDSGTVSWISFYTAYPSWYFVEQVSKDSNILRCLQIREHLTKEREDQKNDLQPWLWLSFH